ncbi:MAG TPA: SPOR domain-containing protein [Candidatus Saccharimonadales bacterium]|nr:SPOR domain-containing protein [Candidatus Saccharimonadales bacterium]
MSGLAWRAGALLLAAALAGGCTRAPRPAPAVGEAPVFPVVGDTAEVLSTLPEPVTHPRPATVEAAPDTAEFEGDTSGAEADTAASDTGAAPAGAGAAGGTQPPPPPAGLAAAPPAAVAGSAPAPAPAGGAPAAPAQQEGGRWVVQVFASADRGAAYREAERAARALGLTEEQIRMSFEGRMWKVRAGSPGTRETAQALLARTRKVFPRAFLLQLPGGAGE